MARPTGYERIYVYVELGFFASLQVEGAHTRKSRKASALPALNSIMVQGGYRDRTKYRCFEVRFNIRLPKHSCNGHEARSRHDQFGAPSHSFDAANL
jgi:hypothetical protein